MSELNNAKAFLATMAEILQSDDVVAEFVNAYLSQLFSNDARLKDALDTSGGQTRNVVLTGPVTAAGVARLFRDRYGGNICYGGAAVSGGDFAGFPKENAFDSSVGTVWSSLQQQNGVSGVSYLGYDFGAGNTKHVRKIVVNQHAYADRYVSSGKIQRSTDGAAWTDVVTVNLYPGKNIIELAASGAYRYWRVMANSNITAVATSWVISELEMYELINPALTNADLIVLADSVMSFAAGMKDGPVDYRYKNLVDRTLGLTAADSDTIPVAYGPNVCRGGTAISGGDNGGYPAANAFDGNTTTWWVSSQVTPGTANVANIGYDFGVGNTKAIRKVAINQPSSSAGMASAKIQYSDNGAAWTDATPATVLQANLNLITVPAVGAHRYWRVLCTGGRLDGGNGIAVQVAEVEMYEAVQTHYIYADYDPYAKAISLGSTKTKPKRAKAGGQTVGGQVPGYYTADLCSEGVVISSGDQVSAGFSKDGAFANDGTITCWRASTAYTALTGVAYIGYDFGAGVAKAVRRVNVIQAPTEYVTSVKIQYSANGAAWTDAVTAAVVAGYGVNVIDVPALGAYRYWRILANSNGSHSEGTWVVSEIEMLGYVEPSTVGAGSTTIQQTAYSADQCVGGTAIESGHYSDRVAAQAFDDSISSSWVSSHMSANQAGNAYIGYGFATAKAIKKVRFFQGNVENGTLSVKVQASNSIATEYVDMGTYDVVKGVWNELSIAAPAEYAYWRILANANLVNGYGWSIYEVEMFTLDTVTVTIAGDDPIYTDNICVGGAAISSGDYAVSGPRRKEYAFDGYTTATPAVTEGMWGSSQVGAAITGTAWIGYDFGAPRHIRKITVYQFTTSGAISSFKVQRSTDGAAWNDVKTVTGAGTVACDTVLLDASAPARYWRLLAQSARIDGDPSSPWNLFEVTMHEIGTDITLYDPYKGESKHYDGSTWEAKIRLFLGEANVDGAGNIVGSTTYPYNLARFKALPAEENDEAVTLGQFVYANGWKKLTLPGGFILQMFQSPAISSANILTNVTLPEAFPNAGLLAVGNCDLSVTNNAVAVSCDIISTTTCRVSVSVANTKVQILALGR